MCTPIVDVTSWRHPCPIPLTPTREYVGESTLLHTVATMTDSMPPEGPLADRPLVDVLCDAVATIGHFIDTAADVPGADRAAQELQSLIAALAAFVAAPDQLDVTQAHRSTAVALVAGYLDGGPGHGLLARLLGDVDRQGIGDPAFRVGLLAALTQLTADALAATAVVWTDKEDASVDETTLLPACQLLLQRLALIDGRNDPVSDAPR